MKHGINNKNTHRKTSLYQKIILILFGLFLTIAIFEISLHIGGFVVLSLQEHRNLESMKNNRVCRIMCLGESTTQHQYPPYLEEILNQRKSGIKFSVIDKGQPRINTEVIMSQLEANLDKYNPDIVVAMMGCNDEGVLYYKDIPEANIGLFQHCRIYRFGRLISMHILNKIKEKGIYGFNNIGLSKALALNPNNDFAYVELGWIYRAHGKFIESEQAFKKALALNPNNDSAYIGLGRFYRAQKKFIESEQAFKKAIALNPRNDKAYACLGYLYGDPGYAKLKGLYGIQKKFIKSEQAFKKAIALNPNNDSAYEGLGQLYGAHGRFVDAKHLFRKAIKLNPNNNVTYGGLAIAYNEIGNSKLSKVYAEKANDIREKYYSSATVNNYQRLRQILDTRKIRLVCVQYPVRNMVPLKKIFMDQVEGDIVFVDNEKIFKDAIKKEGYKDYFIDMFAGDFGHCTEKGNRLLAENIANVILEGIFNK